ncbi:MAG: MASE3 domain-containing protein, partial [Solirubrobacterales bacterium]
MRLILSVALLIATLFGIYLTSVYDYLLFHGLAEIFSIVIACGIFMVAWNARRLLQNHYLLFAGIAYLYVGGLDTLHTLAYKGMGVFGDGSANLPTQLWIAARYVEAFSLLLAMVFLRRRVAPRLVVAAYTLATGILLAAIFWWRIFPDCYVEGIGLTPFKIYSEYAISLIFLAAIGLLVVHSKVFERNVLILLVASIAVAIASELAFTTYLSVYGHANMMGHLLKIVSFYLLYKAIVQTSLVAPWNLLFRELKQSEEALRELNATLENRVAERTEELEHRT